MDDNQTPTALEQFFQVTVQDGAGNDLPKRPKVQIIGGAGPTDDAANNRILLPVGGGGIGLASYFVSMADEGAAAAIPAGLIGDFTVGIGFQFTRPVTWTGVRFSAHWAGAPATRIWKARASIATAPTSEIQNVLSGPLGSGTNTILWATPIAITNISLRHTVSVWDTTVGGGKIYAGYSVSAGQGLVDFEEKLLMGPSIWKFQHHSFVIGDGVFYSPSNASSDTMAVEPVFTVP